MGHGSSRRSLINDAHVSVRSRGNESCPTQSREAREDRLGPLPKEQSCTLQSQLLVILLRTNGERGRDQCTRHPLLPCPDERRGYRIGWSRLFHWRIEVEPPAYIDFHAPLTSLKELLITDRKERDYSVRIIIVKHNAHPS